jgi:hypothetical protein
MATDSHFIIEWRVGEDEPWRQVFGFPNKKTKGNAFETAEEALPYMQQRIEMTRSAKFKYRIREIPNPPELHRPSVQIKVLDFGAGSSAVEPVMSVLALPDDIALGDVERLLPLLQERFNAMNLSCKFQLEFLP